MEKKFYEYSNLFGSLTVNEVTYPHCPMGEEDPYVFLVYAENEREAFRLAMAHIYGGRPMNQFTGIYKGERYSGVRCVMEIDKETDKVAQDERCGDNEYES